MPGFRVIVLAGPWPEIFEGGSNFGLLGYFRNKVIGPPVKKTEFIFGVEQIANAG